MVAIFGRALAQTGDQQPAKQATPKNFLRENLVAWCIVPFDVKERGAEARAQMLANIGMKRCAYDWREQHV